MLSITSPRPLASSTRTGIARLRPRPSIRGSPAASSSAPLGSRVSQRQPPTIAPTPRPTIDELARQVLGEGAGGGETDSCGARGRRRRLPTSLAADCQSDRRCGSSARRAGGEAMLRRCTLHSADGRRLLLLFRPHPRARGPARRPRHRPEDDRPPAFGVARSPSSGPRRRASTTPACRSRTPTCTCAGWPKRCGASSRWSAEPALSWLRCRASGHARSPPLTAGHLPRSIASGHQEMSMQTASFDTASAAARPWHRRRGRFARPAAIAFGSKPPGPIRSRTCARCSACAIGSSPARAAPAFVRRRTRRPATMPTASTLFAPT